MSDRDQFIPPASPVPAGWQESAGFRETYLLAFPRPEDASALRHVAGLLHELALEYARHWTQPEEPAGLAELRAAARDLRHLQGFLANAGRAREVSSLKPPEEMLSDVAAELAPEAARLAETLERAVEAAEEEPPKPA